MKSVIVSASDSGFYRLLQGLVLSLRERAGGEYPIFVLDLGLTDEQKAWLVRWNIEIGNADHEILPGAVGKPGLLTVAQRPYLPDLIPDYDMYIWMDADLWLQRPEALHLYISSARNGAMAITPELHMSYPGLFRGMKRIREDWAVYSKLFNSSVAEKMTGVPALNGGMLALRGDSSFWLQWRKTFHALHRKTGSFYSEQYALNHTVYVQGAAAVFLPAWCNWICHKCLPKIDVRTGRLYEASPYPTEIGVVHMTMGTKNGVQNLVTMDGGLVRRSIRYRGDEF